MDPKYYPELFGEKDVLRPYHGPRTATAECPTAVDSQQHWWTGALVAVAIILVVETFLFYWRMKSLDRGNNVGTAAASTTRHIRRAPEAGQDIPDLICERSRPGISSETRATGSEPRQELRRGVTTLATASPSKLNSFLAIWKTFQRTDEITLEQAAALLVEALGIVEDMRKEATERQKEAKRKEENGSND
jgi:hypothetical protein